jgi:hypothetical protein
MVRELKMNFLIVKNKFFTKGIFKMARNMAMVLNQEKMLNIKAIGKMMKNRAGVDN